jgi:hypothetical protein
VAVPTPKEESGEVKNIHLLQTFYFKRGQLTLWCRKPLHIVDFLSISLPRNLQVVRLVPLQWTMCPRDEATLFDVSLGELRKGGHAYLPPTKLLLVSIE